MKTERTTYFLMANLGSELIRFFGLQKKGSDKDAHASMKRALAIIHQLMERDDIGHGREELQILKKHLNDITERDLNRYFMPFATRALTAV